MAGKKEEKPAAPPPAAEAKPAKGGLPIKTIGIVGVIMVLEAVAVFFIFSKLGPKPVVADVHATDLKEDATQEMVEIPVLEDKFQNHQQGKVWFWDVKIVVQTKAKNQEMVTSHLENRSAEVQEGIGQIIARAQPAQLKEPDRQTIVRQVSAYLNQLLGNDAEGHGLIERVLIPRCRGVPGEF